MKNSTKTKQNIKKKQNKIIGQPLYDSYKTISIYTEIFRRGGKINIAESFHKHPRYSFMMTNVFLLFSVQFIPFRTMCVCILHIMKIANKNNNNKNSLAIGNKKWKTN